MYRWVIGSLALNFFDEIQTGKTREKEEVRKMRGHRGWLGTEEMNELKEITGENEEKFISQGEEGWKMRPTFWKCGNVVKNKGRGRTE